MDQMTSTFYSLSKFISHSKKPWTQQTTQQLSFFGAELPAFLAPLLDPVADLILMAMRPMTRHCAVMAVALSMAWAGGGHRVEADAAENMGESVLDLRENLRKIGFVDTFIYTFR
jgi:hypothetical protein